MTGRCCNGGSDELAPPARASSQHTDVEQESDHHHEESDPARTAERVHRQREPDRRPRKEEESEERPEERVERAAQVAVGEKPEEHQHHSRPDEGEEREDTAHVRDGCTSGGSKRGSGALAGTHRSLDERMPGPVAGKHEGWLLVPSRHACGVLRRPTRPRELVARDDVLLDLRSRKQTFVERATEGPKLVEDLSVRGVPRDELGGQTS